MSANVVIEIVANPCAELSSKVTVVRIRPQRAAIKWSQAPKEEFDNDYPSIGKFVGDLIKGEIKGFIRPRNDVE